MLNQELGVAPLEETAALFEQVSEGTLGPPGAPAAVALERAPSSATRPSPPPARFPLVGRAAELDALRGAQERVAGSGGLAVIEGEGGIGKTRLAEELLAGARAGGAQVLMAGCHEDEATLPYGPVMPRAPAGSRGSCSSTTRTPPIRRAWTC